MTITPIEGRRERCGAAMMRCGNCDQAVAKPLASCPKCGSDDLGPSTCRRWPMGRSARCDMHGGSSPQVRHKGAVAELEARTAKLVASMGWEPCDNPSEALSDLVGEVLAFKDVIRARIDERRDVVVVDQLGREEINADIAAYERALDRCSRILVDVSKLGHEERRVRVTESQHNLMVTVLEAGMAELAGLDPKAIDVRSWLANKIEALEAAS